MTKRLKQEKQYTTNPVELRMCHLETLSDLWGSTHKQFVNLLTNKKLEAIGLLQDKENLINKIWQDCADIPIRLTKEPKLKEEIISMPEFLQKNNWETWVDKLNTLKPKKTNMEHMKLLAILVRELILTEKDWRNYWTSAYSELSEKLSSPIVTGSLGSDLNLSNPSYTKKEENWLCCRRMKTKVQNKSSLKISYPSYIYSPVDKWENVVTRKKLLTLSLNQKKIIDNWIATARYVYNRANEYIKNGHPAYCPSLKELLVTEKYRKKDADGNRIINTNIKKWELDTPCETRTAAVEECCKNYRTNIGMKRKFEIKYKKKSCHRQTITLSKKSFSIKEGKLYINPRKIKEDFGQIEYDKINHDCKIVKEYNKYWLHVSIDKEQEEQLEHMKNKQDARICGIDPGLRTFMTIYSPDTINEIDTQKIIIDNKNNRGNLIDKLNMQINSLKNYNREYHKKKNIERLNKKLSKKNLSENQISKINKKIEWYQKNLPRLNKLALRKREYRKINLTDSLHWKTINYLHSNYDVICYGDIKSHNIVKGNKNSSNNTKFNDYKFYKFKLRLEYKSGINNKKLILVNEHLTSQVCSNCGKINEVGGNKEYKCPHCNLICDRDINSAKNMYLKGILD